MGLVGKSRKTVTTKFEEANYLHARWYSSPTTNTIISKKTSMYYVEIFYGKDSKGTVGVTKVKVRNVLGDVTAYGHTTTFTKYGHTTFNKTWSSEGITIYKTGGGMVVRDSVVNGFLHNYTFSKK